MRAGTVSDTDEDLTAIVGYADELVTMLAKRDKTIRSLASSVADSAELFAGQRENIAESLTTLDELSRKMTEFIHDNETVMTRTADRTSAVLGTIAEQREAIASAFNTLPLAAENIARAYDPATRDLRVRLDSRRTAPHGEVARESFCNAFVPKNIGVCDVLVEDNAAFFRRLPRHLCATHGRSDPVMRTSPMSRATASVALAAAFTLGACGGPDLYDVPLPSKVTGKTYPLSAEFASALNLPPASPVKLEGRTVGQVAEIFADSWLHHPCVVRSHGRHQDPRGFSSRGTSDSARR